MVPLIYRGTRECVQTREGCLKIGGSKRQFGRFRLSKKRGKTKKMCAEVILGSVLHVVGCIVPLPHPRPQCLAEHWSTSADDHMKGLFVRSHFSPKPRWMLIGCSPSMLSPVVHYTFKLRLYPLGRRVLAMPCGVHEAMKSLAVFYLAACAAGDLAPRCCRCVTTHRSWLTCHTQKH